VEGSLSGSRSLYTRKTQYLKQKRDFSGHTIYIFIIFLFLLFLLPLVCGYQLLPSVIHPLSHHPHPISSSSSASLHSIHLASSPILLFTILLIFFTTIVVRLARTIIIQRAVSLPHLVFILIYTYLVFLI
jgi:hypothetical protein